MMLGCSKTISGWWYTYPIWKNWVRQLGWWHSQYMESHKIHAPNHQSVMSWFRSPLWLWIYRDISARNLKLLELQRNLASGHHLVVMGWGAARGKLDGGISPLDTRQFYSANGQPDVKRSLMTNYKLLGCRTHFDIMNHCLVGKQLLDVRCLDNSTKMS